MIIMRNFFYFEGICAIKKLVKPLTPKPYASIHSSGDSHFQFSVDFET